MLAATLILLVSSIDSASAITRLALRAVEGDSVAAFESRLVRRSDPVALLGLATLARLTYQYERADSIAHLLLARRDAGSAVHAETWLLLAGSSLAAGSWSRADSAYRDAATFAAGINDSIALADALAGLAVTQARLAGLAAARALADSAFAIAPVTDPAVRALVQCRRADLLESLADSSSLREAQAGMQLARATGDRRTEAGCLRVIARHALRTDGTRAATIMGDVAELQRLARDDAGRATTLQWRGYTWATLGEFGLARTDLDLAVPLARASRNHAALAWASLNLANVAMFFGDARAALRHAATAESLFVAQGDRVGLALTTSARGRAAMARGDYDAAEPLLRHALARDVEAGGPWPKFGHKALADLEIARGDWSAALAHLDTAAAISRERGEVAYANGLDYARSLVALRQGRLDDARRLLVAMFERLAGDPQRSRRYVAHTTLGAVYARQGNLDAAARQLTAASDTLDQWRASLGNADLRLAAYAVREEDLSLDFGFNGALVDLVRGGRIDLAFGLAERRRARDLSDRMLRVGALGARDVPVSAADLRKGIPDDETALVEFLVSQGGDSSIAFVTTRAGTRAALLPPGSDVAELAETMLALVEAGEGTDSVARRAGGLLFDPVLALLGAQVQRITLVPDGPLHRLPFDALVLSDGRRVVQRFALALAPSATIAVRLWQRPPSSGTMSLLAFGAPDFSSAVVKHGELVPLPASAREVRAAGRSAPGATVRLGANASESWLKQSGTGQYRILHFATHALVDDESMDRTALVLSAGDGDDGFVSPAELAALDLDADVVVLSGCRTARGVVFSGEGVQGLAAPLLEAGTRSVLATLWSVTDRDAATLVAAFYRAVGGGATVGDALAEAKRAAITEGKKPAIWAAFVLVGNPDARPPLPPAPAGDSWWGRLRGLADMRAVLPILVALLVWQAVRRRRRA